MARGIPIHKDRSMTPREQGVSMKAAEVMPGMAIFLDNFERLPAGFHEVIRTLPIEKGWVRIVTPSTLASNSPSVTHSDFPSHHTVVTLPVQEKTR